jgi:hypothetical protein
MTLRGRNEKNNTLARFRTARAVNRSNFKIIFWGRDPSLRSGFQTKASGLQKTNQRLSA